MKQYWNQIQPIDSYQVSTNGILHEFDRKVISFLYQPLIGPICSSLLMTLWNEVEENRLWSQKSNHYQLMNFMSLNLPDIYEARLKLEGIGLLKVFAKETDGERSFIYELQPPLSPDQFFSDGMLNVYLYRKLGRSHFLRIKQFFMDQKANKQEFSEITRAFQDVFSSGDQQSFMDDDVWKDSSIDDSRQLMTRTKAESFIVRNDEFDFELLMSGLQDSIVPKKAMTKKARQAIEKLAFLYQIDAVEMKKIVMNAITDDQRIDIELLRKTARDWYQVENGDQLPQLVDRLQPPAQSSKGSNDKEEKLIQYFETTSPRQLLRDISNGADPSKADLAAVEEVMFNQKLEAGIVNVLIQYVMLKTDMKLSKNYLEKIASHWARKNIKTVKEAMDLAKQEHRQYQDWAEGKKTAQTAKKTSWQSKPTRTEKLPDWFVEDKDQGSSRKQPVDSQDDDIEEKRRKAKMLQEKYKK
ncbi:replication initiation and membrane attachment family protein [Falsibacillus albus]|uniref:Replication initiation and membrane attachment protein n=1 Tax=Falsibacillus albus TaxID=2478915 RepID=A0A3L7K561_9BACI|nr:replication initiation and membrane attachment family protein [Falsibacillus albus]RLQ97980.1 Replication initiation and membrane attachment protein [Falsibacillus albus]